MNRTAYVISAQHRALYLLGRQMACGSSSTDTRLLGVTPRT